MCHMSTPCFAPAVQFFADLEHDNTREFWTAERHRYDQLVKPPFLELLDELDGVGGTWRVYRPHNDTRFGSTKGPYKTFIGAVTERADGVGTFVQISGRGVLVGTGMPMLAPDQLAVYRTAVAADTGAELDHAIARVRGRGVDVHGGRWEPLRRVPRGHDAAHPRADLLRWKGVESNTRVTTPPWPTPAAAAVDLRLAIDRAADVDDWLGRRVGPSTLTPEERFAPRRR